MAAEIMCKCIMQANYASGLYGLQARGTTGSAFAARRREDRPHALLSQTSGTLALESAAHTGPEGRAVICPPTNATFRERRQYSEFRRGAR